MERVWANEPHAASLLPIQMAPANKLAGVACGPATLVEDTLVTQPKPPDIATSHRKACEGRIYVFLCDDPWHKQLRAWCLLSAPSGG